MNDSRDSRKSTDDSRESRRLLADAEVALIRGCIARKRKWTLPSEGERGGGEEAQRGTAGAAFVFSLLFPFFFLRSAAAAFSLLFFFSFPPLVPSVPSSSRPRTSVGRIAFHLKLWTLKSSRNCPRGCNERRSHCSASRSFICRRCMRLQRSRVDSGAATPAAEASWLAHTPSVRVCTSVFLCVCVCVHPQIPLRPASLWAKPSCPRLLSGFTIEA